MSKTIPAPLQQLFDRAIKRQLTRVARVRGTNVEKMLLSIKVCFPSCQAEEYREFAKKVLFENQSSF